MALLIGFTGKAESGKNSASVCAEELIKSSGYSLYSLAFADSVKELAAKVFNVPHHKFIVNKHQICEKWGMTYRELLQLFGTDFARDMIHPDFWVKKFDERFKELSSNGTNIVLVTDVRFNNEAEYIINKGGAIISIERPVPNKLNTAAQSHKSEIPIADTYIFKTIQNDGNLTHLCKAVEFALKPILLSNFLDRDTNGKC